MQFTRFSGSIAVLGLSLAVFAPLEASAAGRTHAAATQGSKVHASYSRYSDAAYASGARANVRSMRYGMATARGAYARPGRYAMRSSEGSSGYSGRLQCVPFARENTGIELSGNASGWWSNAEGVYARGARPEVGSILNFRANGRMRMGHVAVVSNVIDSRNIQIDHANWAGLGNAGGNVSRNIMVVDVSDRNDWTAVRVALGHSGDFGSVYPTYGFIYDRADTGVMTANADIAPAPMLSAAARDLRPATDRTQFAGAQDVEEVAEAEDEPRVRGSRHSSHRVSRFTRSARVATSKATVQRVTGRPVAAGRAGHGSHRHRT